MKLIQVLALFKIFFDVLGRYLMRIDAHCASTFFVQVNMDFLRVLLTRQVMIIMIGIVFELLHVVTRVVTYCIWSLQILTFNCCLAVSWSSPVRRTSSEAVLSMPLMRTENGPSCGFISELFSVIVIIKRLLWELDMSWLDMSWHDLAGLMTPCSMWHCEVRLTQEHHAHTHTEPTCKSFRMFTHVLWEIVWQTRIALDHVQTCDSACISNK